jgi:uncharacterized OB-fold protein
VSLGLEPVPTPDTLPYWQAALEGRLAIQACNTCKRYFFYPRSGCPNCGSTDVEWRDVSGRGRLISYVINHKPLPPADPKEPQINALIELDEGVRMVSNLVGVPPEPDMLPLGSEVTVDFDQRGDWRLPVFRLAGAS